MTSGLRRAVMSSGQWKPLKIDPDLLSRGDFDGLAGIEELTNYSIHREKDSSEVSDEDTSVALQQMSRKIKASNKGLKSKNDTKRGKKVHKKKDIILNAVGNGLPAVMSTSKWESRCLGQFKVENPRDLFPKKVFTEERSSAKALEKDERESPLGMEAWNGLGVPVSVLCALSDVGFTTPTNIQALALPAAIFGRRDILGAAETGSGKTLAFGIPILSGILQNKQECDEIIDSDKGSPVIDRDVSEDDLSCDDLSDNELIGKDDGEIAELVQVIDNANFDSMLGEKGKKEQYAKKPLYALILTPTRELAIQVKQHIQTAAKYSDISIAVVVGGMSSQKQNRILNRAPEIIVATPGRLWDLISEGHPHLLQVENIRYLAIDETDRMLEKGHFDELQRLLERINTNNEQKKRRQNFVFSATLSLTHDVPHYIKKKRNHKKTEMLKVTPAQKLTSIMKTVGLTDPKVVDITETLGVAHTLTEAQIVSSLEEKDYYLYYFLLQYPGRTLIFCNSINCVKRLSKLCSLLRCPTSPLHAHMHQSQRLKNLERFRDNPNCVLIATDVAARGLDIPNVQHVIHYQLPRTAESYVHRSGRTARAHKSGLTVTLVEPGEVRNFSNLFRTLGRDSALPVFPIEEKLMPAVKQRVNLARQLETLELQERRSTAERGWIGKMAKEMDIEVTDNESSDDELSSSPKKTSSMIKKRLAEQKKQLDALLDKPLFPKGFCFKFPTYTSGERSSSLPNTAYHDSEMNDNSALRVLKDDVKKKQAEKRRLSVNNLGISKVKRI